MRELVEIVWTDAWFDPDQSGASEWRTDYPVHTVGFLVRETPAVISVAQEMLPDGDGYRAVTHIPRALIVATRLHQKIEDDETRDFDGELGRLGPVPHS